MRVYFDNAATTPIHPEVIEYMTTLMSSVYGNPSSIHQSGRQAKTIVEEARKTVAKLLNSSIGEIFFTSSATESNNMLLRKAVSDLEIINIITSPTEHPCVLNTLKDIQKEDLRIQFLKVDGSGNINVKELEEKLKAVEGKTLVSLMHVNNELGTIHDIKAISNLCYEYSAYFHCDAVQAIGKIPINLQEMHIHFLSGSAHKFHGPKGIGFMYINNDVKLTPFITGGGQEREFRSGTENVHGMAGLAKALEIYHVDHDEKINHITNLRNTFKARLKTEIPDVRFVEEEYAGHYLPHILSVSFPENAKTELITFNLDISGISASAGSACASGVEHASHVLEAIGFPEDRRAVRFSFSYFNTMEEIDYSIEQLKKMF